MHELVLHGRVQKDQHLHWPPRSVRELGTKLTTAMSIVKEFREFALRGNVLDLAVGVIIGVEFGKIVNSMINDLIMPVIARAMGGGVDFTNKFIPLADKVTADNLKDARDQGAVLAWGNFVTVTINFVILAFCVFLVVKAFNTAKKRFETEQAPPPPAGPTKDQILLMEIRDALKSR